MKTRNPHIALEGKGLSIGYSHQKGKKEILSDLAFKLFSGELTCLLGPNGVGKSTLVKSILGQIQPWKGELLLQNKGLAQFNIEDLAKQISVVLTEPVFPGNMTVGQLVALGRTPHTGWSGRLSDKDREIVEKALEETKILYLRDERLGEISDGQRQKAMIARALAQDGQVMILDEPTAHLDLVNRLEIMHLLREIAQEKNKAILVVTHDLEIAVETADRFWVLTCGSPMLIGRPEDLMISGEINLLLPGKKYQFSKKTGRLELQLQNPKMNISGPKELVYWVEKSLRKAGIDTHKEPIEITSEPFSIYLGGESFSSVESLIDFLNS